MKQSHLYAVIANYDVVAKRQNNLLRLEKHSSLKQSRNPVGQRPDGGFHHLVPVIAKRQKNLPCFEKLIR
jgi:hypothetical protein